MTLIINNFLTKAKKNKENHQKGFQNCIPFYNAPRFNSFIPGILQGRIYLISALMGVGKSKFIRGFLLRSIFDFMNKHKHIPVKIYFVSLEETEDSFISALISQRLQGKFPSVKIGLKELLSLGTYTVDPNMLRIIEEDSHYYNNLLSKINFITKKNIDDLYSYFIEEALKEGQMINDVYIKNDPACFKIILMDHYALLTGRDDIKETINTWTRDMSIDLKNIFDYSIIGIQQQSLGTLTAKSVYDLEPRIEKLGDHRPSAQDADFFIGIFQPSLYEWVSTYMGYDTRNFGTLFRSAVLQKNRLGSVITRVPFYMNPYNEIYYEIPSMDNIMEMISFQNKHGLNILKEYQPVPNYYDPSDKIPLDNEDYEIEDDTPPF
jgi:hypothetical protein